MSEDDEELAQLIEQQKKLKKKKESKTEIHQSVNVSIGDSVINRSSIGTIGTEAGEVNIDKEVESREISSGGGNAFCTGCGSKLPTSYKANFCPECGAEVEK